MYADPRECLFCHDGLPVVPDEPVNVAFLRHIEARQSCGRAFDAWRDNMQTDYIGY
ncbi:MAG: DUF7501 family protein [Thermoplasmatota archaeon]